MKPKQNMLYKAKFFSALGLMAVTGLIGSFLSNISSVQAATDPELPRTYLTTTVASTPVTGQTINVGPGGDFQAALNSANLGDEIVLAAGSVYTGNFILPNKTVGSGWITIRSSNMAGLPGEGTRVGPYTASAMPKILSANTDPTINTANGAHHYRFMGVEISVTADSAGDANQNGAHNSAIVKLGSDRETVLANQAHHFIFDRVYLHGQPHLNTGRGAYLDSRSTAIVDSYLSDFHYIGRDSQAILTSNSDGPFKFVNNYIEAAGENFMSGGVDPAIPNIVPSDMEIRRNYFYKPLSWRVGDSSYAGYHWSIKNLFELKNAQRVFIDGNIFENNWVDAQSGVAILFKSANQDGACNWCVTQHVTFSNNIVRHAAGALSISAKEAYNGGTAIPVNHIKISNVLFDDISDAWGSPGGSRGLFIANGAHSIIIDHITLPHSFNILYGSDDGAPNNTDFVLTNSIVERGAYGIGAGGNEGAAYLSTKFGPYVYNKVGIINSSTGAETVTNEYLLSRYPFGSSVVSGKNGIGFVNWQAGGIDYHGYALASNSPFKNFGTNGKDLGVDFAALDAALAGNVLPRLPQGTFVKVVQGPTVWMIEGNTARPIASLAALHRLTSNPNILTIGLDYLHTYSGGEIIK